MSRRSPPGPAGAGGRVVLRPLDILAVALCLAVVAVVAARAYGARGERALVELDGRDGQWLYPLESSRTVLVAGPLGETTVVIAGGKVRVTDSPCPEKICVRTGAVSRPGQFIACLPNRVFVAVKGAPEGAIDAYSF